MEKFSLKRLHDLKRLFSTRSIVRFACAIRAIIEGSNSSASPEVPVEDTFRAFYNPEAFLIVSTRMREVEAQKAMAIHDIKRNELF